MLTDQRLHEIRLAVLAALAASEKPNAQLWMAYDPILGHTLPLDRGVTKQRDLVLPKHLSVDTDLAPRLVALAPDPHERLLEASLAKACEETASPLVGQRSVGGWAWLTEVEAARLAGASHCMRAPDGERWARWHDPRVMHQWMELHAQPAYGPLALALQSSTWVFLDLSGQVRQLALPPMQTDPTRAPGWLDQDIELLSRSADALALVDFWLEGGRDGHKRLLADCHAALEAAQRRNLRSSEDRLSFAKHHLLEPSLMDAADVQLAIQASSADPGSLAFNLPPALVQARAKLPLLVPGSAGRPNIQ